MNTLVMDTLWVLLLSDNLGKKVLDLLQWRESNGEYCKYYFRHAGLPHLVVILLILYGFACLPQCTLAYRIFTQLLFIPCFSARIYGNLHNVEGACNNFKSIQVCFVI